MKKLTAIELSVLGERELIEEIKKLQKYIIDDDLLKEVGYLLEQYSYLVDSADTERIKRIERAITDTQGLDFSK